ncbi:MAG: MMPL family transporter [Thermoplasmata archaeon]|nr:MAG: MMPL family transporter [Thermoplasmata archaeon]
MKHSRVHLGNIISRYPGRTFAIVMIVTFIMFMINFNSSMFGLEKKTEASEDAWLPDNELTSTLDDLQNNYGSSVSFVQILVKGKNNNVITKEAFIDILEVEKQISENEKVQYVLYPQSGNIMSMASAMTSSFMLGSGIPPSNITYDSMIDFLENNITQLQIEGMFTYLWNSPVEEEQEAIRQGAVLLSKDFVGNMDKGIVKAKATLMLVMYDSEKYDEIEDDENPIVDADLEIIDIIDGQKFDGVDYMGIYESQYVEYVINTDVGMMILFLLVIIIIVVIMFLTYKSVLDTVLSLSAIFLAIIWMGAFGVLLGLTFADIYEAVPIILIGIGVDYAIHITLRYREERERERKAVRGAMLLAVATVGASLFLSSLTTGFSFASMGTSEMPPMREFGIFLMLGIFCCFILVVTLIPSAKVLADTYKLKRQHKKEKKLREAGKENEVKSKLNPGPEKMNDGGTPKKKKEPALDRGLGRIGDTAARKPGPIIAIALVLAILCGYMALQLETEFDYKEFLPSRHQVTDDIGYIFDNFYFGVDEADVLIRADLTDPAVLEGMDEIQQNIENDKYINQEEPYTSVLTLMQAVASDTGTDEIPPNAEFRVAFEAADTDDDGVPDENIGALYDFLRANETYQPLLANVLYYNKDSGKYEGALIRVSVNTHGGDYNGEIADEMEANIKPLENKENVEVFATGQPIITDQIITSIQTSGLQSLVITIIIAAIILCALFTYEFRSISLGLFTEVPVVLVILWIYGTMYLGGVPLTVMTIMICTITIGIGIDYAIHITNRFMESIHDDRDVSRAIRHTVVNTGGALFGAAVTTVGGFGILFFAPTNPMRMFGTFTALAITFALISSIIVLPAMLGVYARWKLSKDIDYFEKHVDITHVRQLVSKSIHASEAGLRHLGGAIIEAEHKFAHHIVEGERKVEAGVKKVGDKVIDVEDKIEKKVLKAEEVVEDKFMKFGDKVIEVEDKVEKGAKKAGKKVVETPKKAVEKMKRKK